MEDMDRKAQARKAAFARRKAVHAGFNGNVAAILSSFLKGYRGVDLAGYMPIRTEIDPIPAMAKASAYGRVGVPVIIRKGQPLKFSEWTPEGIMKDGPYGAKIPVEDRFFDPEIVIVPLVAVDKDGGRLGYGGGFYDRTLEVLRRKGPTLAIGFAYSDQMKEHLPLEPTDQPLDLLITEKEIFNFQ